MTVQMGPVWTVRQLRMGSGRMLLAVTVGTAAAGCAVALLGVSGWLIATAAGLPPVLTLTVAAVLVRALAIGRGVLRYTERLVGHDAALAGLGNLRVAVYEQLVRLAPAGLLRYGRGDLLGRLAADVDQMLDLPLRVVLPWFQVALVSSGTVAFFVWLLPEAAGWLTILVLIGLVLVPAISVRLVTQSQRKVADSRAAVNQQVLTALTGVNDLWAFNATVDATAVVRASDLRWTAQAQRSAWVAGIGTGLAIALQGAAVCLVLLIATPHVVNGELGAPWLAVAAFLPLALFELIAGLAPLAVNAQGVRASASRIAALHQAPSPVTEPLNPVSWPRGGPIALECRDLSAGWGARRAIEHVDLDVAAGEYLAVLGPSGAGKSTLGQVLVRFLDYSGSVRMQGCELRTMGSDEIRRHVGLLSQRAQLFHTSIRENLTLGRRIGDAALWSALQQVDLAEWVAELPSGLSTDLGPFGMALSGGQAHRLALARLIIEPRDLIVLDEPFEHLDTRTARALQVTCRSIFADTTLVMITHDLTTVQDHDHCLILGPQGPWQGTVGGARLANRC